MNERIFISYNEYKKNYFPDAIEESFPKTNGSVASQLAIRAIEKHSEKLKKIECAEPVNCLGRTDGTD